MLRSILLAIIAIILCSPLPSRAETVRTGDQVLYDQGFQLLKGKKFALITNQSATVGGMHILDLMAKGGVKPAVIFAPEHGLRGKAEDGVKVSDSAVAGIPLKSLYGARKKAQLDDLKGLDLVLFDIQDVGVRFYTYISTMGYMMQAAAQAGVPFVVLDRPNPLGGDYVAGFVREVPASFTSLYPIPVAHGMTTGELAGMIKGEAMLPGLSQLELSVVRMEGWKRWMRWPDTGLPWVATSPNLASFDAALLYPATGLLEGTSASEGRGSKTPFRLAGWPGIDEEALAQKLNNEELPGLHFEPARYTPVSIPGVSSAPKYKNREVRGVRIEITDYRSVLPVEAGVAIVGALYASVQEPARKVFFHGGIDDMSGSAKFRKGVQGGESAAAIVSRWGDGLRRFLHQRQGYLLYDD